MNIDERNMNWIIYRLKKQISMKAIWNFFFFPNVLNVCCRWCHCEKRTWMCWHGGRNERFRRIYWNEAGGLALKGVQWHRRMLPCETSPLSTNSLSIFEMSLWTLLRLFEDSLRILWGFFDVLRSNWKILWRFFQVWNDSVWLLWVWWQFFGDSLTFYGATERFFRFYGDSLRILSGLKRFCVIIAGFCGNFFEILWCSTEKLEDFSGL